MDKFNLEDILNEFGQGENPIGTGATEEESYFNYEDGRSGFGGNDGEDFSELEFGPATARGEGSYLSNKIAIEIIEQQMEETAQAIDKLTEMIEENPQTSNKVIRERNELQVYYENLETKANEISQLDMGYVSSGRDRRYSETKDKRETLESERGEQDPVENKIIKWRITALGRQIERLKGKEGKIEKRQRAVVNRKLKWQLRKMASTIESIKYIRELNNESYKEKYSSESEQYLEKMQAYFDEGIGMMGNKKYVSGAMSFISGGIKFIPAMFSYVKMGTLISSCYTMSGLKIGFYYGCRELPCLLASKIREKFGELTAKKPKASRK